jgi:hypothetical protein
MWFWPVNKMIELVSSMPAPQFGDESSWVWGSELVQGSSGSCVSFWLMYDVLKYHRGYAYHRLKTTALKPKYFASTSGQFWVTVYLRWAVPWGSHYETPEHTVSAEICKRNSSHCRELSPDRQTGHCTDSFIPVIFNLFCSRTPHM